MVRQRLAWWLRRLPATTALGPTRAVVAERLRCQNTLDEHYIRHVDETIRSLWADLKAAPDREVTPTTRVASIAAVSTAPAPRRETLHDLAHDDTDAATDMGRWVAGRIAAQILAAPDRDQHHVLDVAHRWWRKNLARARGLDYAGLAYATAVVERAIAASGTQAAAAGAAGDLELDAAGVPR
ncbi:hypothetical protein ACQCX5_10060 [Propionibacteriaceae bacterium G57]|uniref:hypothetical protein n=1 Tax=Aestuariimicrobium sp. G57 TaxID=3418485 RepID=UPI003DA71F92